MIKQEKQTMNDLLDVMYDPTVKSVRDEIAQDPTLRTLLDDSVSPKVLERFLIEWCARGVQVTEPVEGWIRRAGERCREVGLDSTGDALLKHAAHEAGHHEMFIADTRALSAHWNERHAQPLDAESLLAQGCTPGMRDYIELHEEVIASSTPFGQVAIEYEIERLSVDVLPSLMQAFERKLGKDVISRLSFLSEHAELDVGHTKLNRKMLGRLLAARPEELPRMVEIGSRALRAYVRFMSDCLEVALREAAASHDEPNLRS
jgi:hypothetical protein